MSFSYIRKAAVCAVPICLLGLLLPNAVFASSPSSPNRLVFNSVEIPPVDLNGDGALDIKDAFVSLPANIDSIVHVGAGRPEFLFQGVGQSLELLPHPAVGSLQDAVTLATQLDVPLFLKGNFAITEPLIIRGQVRIEGFSDSPGVIHAIGEGNVAAISILRGVSNVRLKDLSIHEHSEVQSSLVLIAGKNENVTLSGLQLTGANVHADAETAGVYMFRDWVSNVTIRDCRFTDLQYGVHCVCGVQGLRIIQNEFRRWNRYAVRIARIAVNPATRTEQIEINRNDFRDPVVGPFRSVILVTRAESLAYVNDVTINHNKLIGNRGAFIRGDQSTNATGDQIVLHGVNGFQVSENHVLYGGENGITASRLSRNGVISRNVIVENDAHGMNIGSGYQELSVPNARLVRAGETIRGRESGATAVVQSVRRHPTGGRTILGVQVFGGGVFRDETLENLTRESGNIGKSFQVDRTKRILVVDNYIYGNGIDSAENTPWTFGVFAQNADSIELRRNVIFNPNFAEVAAIGGIQDQRYSIYLANCRDILITPDNRFERARQTLGQAVLMNRSSWLTNSLPQHQTD